MTASIPFEYGWNLHGRWSTTVIPPVAWGPNSSTVISISSLDIYLSVRPLASLSRSRAPAWFPCILTCVWMRIGLKRERIRWSTATPRHSSVGEDVEGSIFGLIETRKSKYRDGRSWDRSFVDSFCISDGRGKPSDSRPPNIPFARLRHRDDAFLYPSSSELLMHSCHNTHMKSPIISRAYLGRWTYVTRACSLIAPQFHGLFLSKEEVKYDETLFYW